MTTTDPYAAINLRATPQSQPADTRQVPNSAGGYTFTLTPEARIRRFLILGSDGATFYTSAADLTKDNAQVVLDFARRDARGLVDILSEISLAGRAPKQNPTLFALAAAASLGDDKAEQDRLNGHIAAIKSSIAANERTSSGEEWEDKELKERLRRLEQDLVQVPIKARRYALDALPNIARTGTHLFLFARYVEQFRGWGRGLRKAVGRWYLDKPVDSLAYQAVKYRQREGWSHRDLLRLSHPETSDERRKALFDWIARPQDQGRVPSLIEAFTLAQDGGFSEWMVGVHAGLSWEMLPDPALSEPKVWEALVEQGMPMTALIRQLPRLTRLGVARTMRTQIVKQLSDEEHLRKARIHPVNVLVALRTYASGQSARGESTWTPDRKIIDALDGAFYKSFGFVEPANKRTLIALDVSGSMGWGAISNMPITPREASSAIAMVTMATEPDCDVVGFCHTLTELPISPRQRLDDVIRTVENLPFGGTDCALPMIWATQNRREYDTFIVMTDNETWAGRVHPHQALETYRQRTGIPARLIVAGMTATNFSIADPSDPGSLDVVGFDSAVPQLITDFSRGF